MNDVHRDNNTKNYSHPVLRLDPSLKLWGEHNKKKGKNFVNKVMLSVRRQLLEIEFEGKTEADYNSRY